MRTYNKQIATSVLLNTNVNGPAEPLKNIVMFSISARISGVPNGTVKLQVSNDPETNDTVPLPPPTNWVDMADSEFTVTTAGTTFWNVHDVAYNYVRVVFTDASGGTSTAVMSTTINSKGV